MKRSDVIEIILQLMAREGLQPWNTSDYEFAKELLYTIENLGMLPPRIDFMIGDKKMSDNAWESEDG